MDNTVFVTTSDHGDFAGDARLVEKWPAVLMTRVPLIISTPGGVKGNVVDSPVQTFDILPTLAVIAKVKVNHKPLHSGGGTNIDDKTNMYYPRGAEEMLNCNVMGTNLHSFIHGSHKRQTIFSNLKVTIYSSFFEDHLSLRLSPISIGSLHLLVAHVVAFIIVSVIFNFCCCGVDWGAGIPGLNGY